VDYRLHVVLKKVQPKIQLSLFSLRTFRIPTVSKTCLNKQTLPRGHFPPFLYITHMVVPRACTGVGLGGRSSQQSLSLGMGLSEIGEDESDDTEDNCEIW